MNYTNEENMLSHSSSVNGGQTDFLVIGSGIAGLTYALKVAQECPDKKITVLTKTQAMKPIPNMHRVALQE